MKVSLKYFYIGSEALQRFHNLPDPYYACPICLRMFGLGDVRQLTQEHVPQESLGGLKICLTCFDCNSNAGHRIDAHVHRREKGLAFFKAILEGGTYEGRAQIRVGGSVTNANLRARDKFVEITPGKEINNPTEHVKLQEALAGFKENGTWERQKIDFNLVGDTFNLHKAMVADLKSAYLVCFAKLGYQYILRPQLDIVRNQILQPELKLIEGFAYRIRPGYLPSRRVLFFVESPFQSAAIQIDDRFIFLPPIDDAEDFYTILKRHLSPDLQLSGFEAGFPTTMEMELDRIEMKDPI